MKKRFGIGITVITVFCLLAAFGAAATIFVADDPALLYNSVGNYYYKLGNVDKAAELYTKALEVDPNNAKAHHNLGVFYYSQKDFVNAKESFEVALSIDDHYKKAHYSLGLLYFETGAISEAIDSLTRTVELDEGNVNAQFDLAVAYVERFRTAEQTGSFDVSQLEDLRKGLAYYDMVIEKQRFFPDAQSNRDIVAAVLADYEAQI